MLRDIEESMTMATDHCVAGTSNASGARGGGPRPAGDMANMHLLRGRRLKASVLVFLTGCSFVLVTGPPTGHERMYGFDCTDSRFWPIADSVWTGLFLLDFTAAASESDQGWDDSSPIARKPSMALYAAFALLSAAGAWYGYTTAGECRDARTRLLARMNQMRSEPAPQSSPSQPAPGPAPSQPPGEQ